METAINEFFQSRKEAWLKKNLKAFMDTDEIKSTEAECDQVFALDNWLPNAAKRAGQISISTHPCTFSHPSARKNKNGYATSIIATKTPSIDGFLRSGNVTVDTDALGNAAALDVYKFLTLVMDDGQNLLTHIQQDTELATELLTTPSTDYATLKAGFLAMVESSSDSVTSSKIKQVYFPVDKGYHQLSLLTASGLIFELRQRLDTLRFSEETKTARACHRENQWHPQAYKQINNLTTIGYGGTKPQNISVLNNQNGGKAHLLLSMPPMLAKREIRFPTQDFFLQTFTPFHCKNTFYALHDLFKAYENNWEIRNERDDYYHEIIDRIIETAIAVRQVAHQQYYPETNQLSLSQRIWLCEEHTEKREKENDWLDDICQQITLFIFHGYEKVLKKQAIIFSDAEFKHIGKQVENIKEALR